MPTIAETRLLLGSIADGKTGAQVAYLGDELAVVANHMFDHLQVKLRGPSVTVQDAKDELPGFPSRTIEQARGAALEDVRWIAYLHENTDDKDAL